MNDAIRVLIFSHDASLHGASRSLLTLLKDWKRSNRALLKLLLPYKGDMVRVLQQYDIDHEIIPFPRCIYKSKLTILQKAKQIIEYFKREKKSMKMLQPIVTDFNPSVIYTNTSVVKIGYEIAKTHDIPHVWHIRELGKGYGFEYVPFRQSLRNKINNSYRIFVSKNLKKAWEKATFKKKGLVIYNGFEAIPQQQYPAEKKNGNGSFSIGLVGAILPGKGQKIAIEAIHLLNKKFPGLRLFIYGYTVDEQYYAELNEMVQSFNLSEHVYFMPFEKNIETIYAHLNCVISCSVCEGFGRTLVEAMYRYIPVIGNNACGIKEIITHMQTGLLYNETPQDLAEKITFLMKNEYLAKKWVHQAYHKATVLYSVKDYSNNVYELILALSLKKQ